MPEQMTKQDAIETLEIFRNDYTREDSAICRAIDIAIDALRQHTIEAEEPTIETEVRLIDANALKAKLKIGTNTATYSDYCNGYSDARQVDLDAIDAAPTIDAEPVRHGHWVFREEATPEYLPWDMWCSCCGEYHDSDDYNDRYCSKCGAKMDADGGTISKERFAEIGGADNG